MGNILIVRMHAIRDNHKTLPVRNCDVVKNCITMCMKKTSVELLLLGRIISMVYLFNVML